MSIRIHQVKTNADKSVDVMYHGMSSDYDYITGCLNNREGVSVSKVPDKSNDVFYVIRVRGTNTSPISEHDIVAMFEADQHIDLYLGDKPNVPDAEKSI